MRLQDQSAKTWRNAKVAAVWGVQILLYPIYVGFQATRLMGKQLRQTARQTLPKLQAVKETLQHGAKAAQNARTDAPIQQTLKTLAALEVDFADADVLLLPAEAKPDIERELAIYTRHHAHKAEHEVNDAEVGGSVAVSESSTPNVAAMRIQGFASLLDTRGLVLVTTRNQILDILSLEQQQQLAKRIVWETANYYHQHRFSRAASSVFVSTFLPLPKDQKNALLPIRAFRKVMAWMQRGSVAASANLFQESRLAYLPVETAASSGVLSPALRSAQPAWVAMETQFYDWLEQTGRATGDLLVTLAAKLNAAQLNSAQPSQSAQLPGQAPVQQPQLPAQNWLAPLNQWLSKISGQAQLPALPSQSLDQPESTTENSFELPNSSLSTSIRALIRSSVGSAALSSTNDPSKIVQSETIQKTVFGNVNAWVRQSIRAILPSQSKLSRTAETTNWELTDTAAIETAIKTKLAANQPQSNRAAALVRQAPVSRGRMVTAPIEADGRPVVVRHREPLEAPLSSLDTANAEEAAMMPQSWIETEAQLVGYVKHPLEQLLEWLDKGMSWLEVRIAKFWQLLTRRLG